MSSAGRVRGVAFWALVVGPVVALMLLVGGGGPESPFPLDPEGNAPVGARATVLLARELGAEVTVTGAVPAPPARAGDPGDPGDPDDGDDGAPDELDPPQGVGPRVWPAQADTGDDTSDDGEIDPPPVGPPADVALVLIDALVGGQRDQMVAFVEGGGTLVIADPQSDFTPEVIATRPPAMGEDGQVVARGRCDLGVLDGVASIVVDGGEDYVVPEGAGRCFGDADAERALVVVERRKAGAVVSIGGGDVFSNRWLDDADAAVVVGRLLVPRDGARVAVLDPYAPAAVPFANQGRSLEDLVPDRATLIVRQLAIAWVIYALFRARRLGRPVAEPLPVQIAGSELTVAVGELLAERRDPASAAALLRLDLRRSIGDRLGLAIDAPSPTWSVALADRCTLSPADLQMVVGADPVPDEASLIRLAQLIESLRQEVLHGHATLTRR